MGLRYLGATIVGYVTFLLLIRAWIALHRQRDAGSLEDLSLPDGGWRGGHADPSFGGGHSGGAGASGDWGRRRWAPWCGSRCRRL